jgi:hypothetical protein
MNFKNAFSILSAALVFTAPVHAELIPGTTLSLDMQSAQIQANGRNVNVYRLPVTDTATGAVTFFDAVFQFGVLSDGSVGFTRTSSAAVSAAQLRAADNFVAGTYRDAAGNLYEVTGPAAMPGGRLSYAIAASTAGKTFSASWITGTASANPQFGSSSTKPAEGSAAAFGVLGDKTFNPSSSTAWGTGYAIGATQLSSTNLVIYSYFGNAQPVTSFSLTKN